MYSCFIRGPVSTGRTARAPILQGSPRLRLLGRKQKKGEQNCARNTGKKKASGSAAPAAEVTSSEEDSEASDIESN